MRVLCVAEKPSIAKSITQILSGGQFATHNTQSNFIKNYEFDYPQTRSFFTVTCVSGHLTSHDFYDTHRKWNSCDAFDLFDAPVETSVAPDKRAIEQNLLSQARRSDMLMIWTDCDREGEHIGLEITRVCRKAKPNIQVKRARFSAIIAQQIHNAAQRPVELDRRQADAVEARIFLDLKVGAAFTRLQTLVLQGRVRQIADEKSVVSYGPCQFPTLGFVVQRYTHVKNFQPEKFWYIYLSLTRQTPSQGNEETRFNWKRHHLFDQAAVMGIYSFMMENPLAVVAKVTNKTTKKWKPLPLTTVELQKAASRLLRLAPKKALDVAERLYQQGYVSYPRTETDQFDPQFDHMGLIAKQTADPAWGGFATSQNGGYNVPRKGKNDDKAHPPIHPTAHANGLTGDEKKVYEYITRRYLACCSKDAEGWQTTVDVLCGGEEFSATGLIVRQRNYLEVYVYEKWTGHLVPDFQEGEEFEPTTCEIREGETSRPNYLTEADLVTLMDKNGIGTDATIAQHIQTIIDRSYVIERMEGATKYLIPSTLGIGLIEGYNQIGLAKNVSKPQLRRETERRMVRVCEGTTTKNDMLTHSLDQYKEMFIIVRREFDKVTSSVQRFLTGEAQNAPGGGGGPGGNGGGGGGGGGGNRNGGPGDHGAGGRGRGRGRGRETPRARGASRGGRGDAPAGRGRGRGAVPPSKSVISILDSDDDVDMGSSTAVASSSRSAAASSSMNSASAATPSASSSTLPSTSRITAPIHLSSTWQATAAPVASTSFGQSSGTRPVATSSAATYVSSSSSNDPQCSCGVAAVQRTVTRETATKGKQFWTCPNRETSCGFFKWAEDTISVASSSSASVPAKRSYSSTRDASSNSSGELVRKCKCNEDAVTRTVTKENENKGREFWKCGKAEGATCGFFEWADEPPRNSTFGGGGGSGGLGSRSTSLNTGSGGGTSGSCFKCNQEGHWASACPIDDTSTNKRPRSLGTNANNGAAAGATCYRCQQVGHFSSSCPNGGSSSNYNNSGSSSAAGACYKCQQVGHYSSSCPNGASSNTYNRSGSSSSNTYSRSASNNNSGGSNECFKCGKSGHWSSKCPNDGGGGGGSKRSGSSKRGRGEGKTKRGGRGGKKKSAFAAADEY